MMSLTGCADQLLLNPSSRALDAHGAQRRTFELHGKSIEIYTARSPGAAIAPTQAYLLEFCGNAGRAENIAAQRAQRWGARPVEVWVMNYPGFGRSAGPATLQSIPAIALEAYDQLAREAGSRPIFIGGYSLGTAVAIFVASHRPAAGLILQNPPPIRPLILDHYGWWNLWLIAWPMSGQVPRELDSVANGPRIKSPALFILGARDGIAPIHYQQMVADAYGGPKQIVLMKDGTHDTIITPAEEARVRADLDWLWDKAMRMKSE